MSSSHPVLVFASSAETWKWCARCQRCYTRPSGSAPDILSCCVYPDCDGAAIVCEYAWGRIRRYDHTFPDTPRFGVRYRVYV